MRFYEWWVCQRDNGFGHEGTNSVMPRHILSRRTPHGSTSSMAGSGGYDAYFKKRSGVQKGLPLTIPLTKEGRTKGP